MREYWNSDFIGIGNRANFWTASSGACASVAAYFVTSEYDEGINYGNDCWDSSGKSARFSVRCIQDYAVDP